MLYISRSLTVLRLCLIATLLLVAYPLAAMNDADQTRIDSARTLLKQGEPNKAYDILLPLEEYYSGTPSFDYLLGIAALDSGDASYAVFALQRALLVNTDFMGAKLDLGRAYFQLGEFNSAEQEFSAVMQAAPTQRVKSYVGKYLERIKNGRPKNRKLSFQIYVDTAGGYDTNANSATEESVFEGQVLQETSTRKPSSYFITSAGTSLSYAILRNLSISSSARWLQKAHQNASFIDSTSMNGNAGLRLVLGKHLLNASSSYMRTYIADNFTGENYSGSTSWMWTPSRAWTLSSFYQLSLVRAAPANAITNTDIHNTGISLALRPTSTLLPNINSSLIYGKALAKQEDSPYGRSMYGIQVGLSKTLAGKLKPNFGASARAIRNAYEGRFSAEVSDNRQDDQIAASLTAGIKLFSGIQLDASFSHTRNFSNVSLYSYSRWDTLLKLRWAYQ